MIRRLALAILIGLVAGLWEAAAVPFLPGLLAVRPWLPLCVLAIIASSRSRALTIAITAGLILDAYSLSGFSFATLRWPALVLGMDALARHFLTNRSLYATVALVAVGRVGDWISAALMTWLVELFLGRETFVPPWSWGTLAWDVALCALGFLILAATTRRFVTFEGRSSAQPYGGV